MRDGGVSPLLQDVETTSRNKTQKMKGGQTHRTRTEGRRLSRRFERRGFYEHGFE